MRLWWLVGLVCWVSTTTAAPVHAQEALARVHDGFYLRLALGGAYLISTHEFERTSYYYPVTTTISHRIDGLAQLGALMLGGTVAEGWVIGGGLWNANVFAPQVSTDPIPDYQGSQRPAPYGQPGSSEPVETGLLSISLLGPFVAWYPNPRAGWHAALAVGYAHASCEGGASLGVVEPWRANGFGAMGAVGHDFWVSDQWSIGAQLGATFMRGASDTASGTFTAFVPALAMTGTYH